MMIRRTIARLYHRAAIWHHKRRLARLVAVPWAKWQNGHTRRIDRADCDVAHHRQALRALQNPAKQDAPHD